MNPHNPTVSRVSAGGSPVLVWQPTNSAQSIPVVIENHGTATVRLVFSDSGSLPDPDAYATVAAGCALECKPRLDIYAYSPSGVLCDVAAITGIRHVGAIGATSESESGASVSSEAATLAILKQKELLAEILVGLRVALRYMAQWEGDEYNKSDALNI